MSSILHDIPTQLYNARQTLKNWQRLRTQLGDELYQIQKDRRERNDHSADPYLSNLRSRVNEANEACKALKQEIHKLEEELSKAEFDDLDRLIRHNHNKYAGSL